jgi:ATP-dependent Clp protease ATP-binding subunit ClpC
VLTTRLTDRARAAIALADAQAGSLGHSYIGTEHLLLGLLLEEQSNPATGPLGEAGIAVPDALRWVSTTLLSEHPTEVKGAESRTFTPAASAALERAAAISSDPVGHRVGVRQLLLALLEDRDGLPSKIIGDLGVDVDQLSGRVRAGDDYDRSPQSGIHLEPVLQQCSVIISMLSQLALRLDSIEGQLKGGR